MGRAILLGLCPSSLHKVEVWACALGFRSGPVHRLFYAPSIIFQLNKKTVLLCTVKVIRKL